MAGSDNGAVLEALRGMWGEMKTMNGRVKEVKEGLEQTNARLEQTNARLEHVEVGLDGLRTEVRVGFATLGARMDNLLLGEHGREHVEIRSRLSRLEARAGVAPVRRRPQRAR